MYVNETIRILTSARPCSGNFAKPKQWVSDGVFMVSTWLYCREVWHRIGKKEKFFFYSHDIGKSKSIGYFIEALEIHLGLENRSIIGPTQRKTISWIKLSPWWISSAMRNSLFTIMLRAADAYVSDRNNFEETLNSNLYIRETRYAVDRFLDGFTRYRGKMSGWYRQFRQCSVKMTDELLIK